MTKHIGITGTRSGANEKQLAELRELLNYEFEEGAVFHHGDCQGVDVEAAAIAKELGYRIVGHIPVKDEVRGFFENDEEREPKGYFARNRDIVDESMFLIVVPWQDQHATDGGTWYTHDYAQKKNKPRYVLFPTNKLTYSGGG